MNSFMGIGRVGAASLAVVAPGIAEALIATAVGLAAAIPAVVAYNYFLSRTRRNILIMEDFSQELLDHCVRKHGETQTGTL
jgi:biopolymer transport protein TolQ